MIIRKEEKRSAVHAKLKPQKKVEKRKKLKASDAVEKRALELVGEPSPKVIPRTIENTREAEETVCKPNDEEEKLATKYASKGMEEGFDPTEVWATSGVKKRQLKGLDIHTHSEDVGVSTSRHCPSRPTILQQSLQVQVRSLQVQVPSLRAQIQTWKEELRKLQEQHAALSQSAQKLQKSLQFLYTQLGITPPPKMIPRTIENTREADETVCKPNDVEEKLATKYVSKGMEEGLDPAQVHGDLLLRATSGVKKRQLKGLDVHTHSEDVGVSASCPCPSKPSDLQQSAGPGSDK
ncbi:hypothetical protein SLA2020_087780 [Shorea laevis]